MPTPSTTGHAPTVRFAPKPAILRIKKTNRDGSDSVSVKALLETHCPSLFKAFQPTWWLFNGHLQTAYCVANTFAKQNSISYRRIHLKLADGGTIGLDFAPADQSRVRDNAPIVVIQHGLAGGSHEHYVREVVDRVCAPPEDNGLGYRAVVINFRGCSDVPLTSQMFYSAGSTDDTRQALIYLNYKYPDAPLIGLGFSLGANLLTRYLGEEGERSKMVAGCVLGCPWDLTRNGESLVSSYIGRHVYSRAMAGGLMRLVRKHFVVLTKDPDHAVAIAARKAALLQNPRLDEFDDTFTVIAGGSSPNFPFPNVMTFYDWVSSHNMLNHIRVPFLSINAEDDPVIKHVPLEDSDNELLTMVSTRHGGHLGWFQSGSQTLDRWTTKPVLEWIELMAQGISHEAKPHSTISIDENGFLREEGIPALGCKVVTEMVLPPQSHPPDTWRLKIFPVFQSFASRHIWA